MLLNILQYTGQPPTAKNYQAQNVNNAKVEKSWSVVILVTNASYRPVGHSYLHNQLFSFDHSPTGNTQTCCTFSHLKIFFLTSRPLPAVTPFLSSPIQQNSFKVCLYSLTYASSSNLSYTHFSV